MTSFYFSILVATPIDGQWGDWSEWGTECDKACGGGKLRRHRFCVNPSAKHGGKDCEGDKVEEKGCNEEPCPG